MFVSALNSENNIDDNAMKLSQLQSESDRNGDGNGSNHERDWEFAKCKADILSHPMYDQLLSAHVSCLRIATPTRSIAENRCTIGSKESRSYLSTLFLEIIISLLMIKTSINSWHIML